MWNSLKVKKNKTILIDKKEYIEKYMTHKFSLEIIAANIQPKWLIDEKAIIFRNEVWFKPPNDPINTEIIITEIIRGLKYK